MTDLEIIEARLAAGLETAKHDSTAQALWEIARILAPVACSIADSLEKTARKGDWYGGAR